MRGFACQNGFYVNIRYSCLFNLLYSILIKVRTGTDKHLVSKRVKYILCCKTPQNTFPKALYNFSSLNKRSNRNTYHGSAILFANNAVLCNIRKPPCKIPRVSCFKRCVCKTFPGAMCRYKILQHGKPFPEIRSYWCFYYFTWRFCHKTAHPCELTHLIFTTPCTRVRHHVDGIETLRSNRFSLLV